MIRSAYKLMKLLNTIVDNDEDDIWIDYERNLFSDVKEANQPKTIRPFPRNEPSVAGLLKLLKDDGYITIDPLEEYCQLTYKSLYYKEIVRHERLHYFLQSIFVPIVLSIITSILTTTFLPRLLSALLQTLK